jgi:hypothetical protein
MPRWSVFAIAGLCAVVVLVPVLLSADLEPTEPGGTATPPASADEPDEPPADDGPGDVAHATEDERAPDVPAADAPADDTPPPLLEVAISFEDPRDVPGWIETVGIVPDVVDVYAAWHDVPAFDQDGAELLDELGITKKITWEPWEADAGAAQPDYALATIADGDHDRYVRAWAEAIVEHDRPVVLRPMHEMNGAWYPWGADVNGNTPDDFVAAWRHLRAVFDDVGADQVVWEWAPNQLFEGTAPLEPLYPGDEYVDRIGISAYNWGEEYAAYHRWREVPPLFDPTIAALRAFASVPIGVAETASSSVGGDKEAWIDTLFAYALEEDLAFLTYFDLDTHRDWRLDHDDAYLEAFRRGFGATRGDPPLIRRR